MISKMSTKLISNQINAMINSYNIIQSNQKHLQKIKDLYYKKIVIYSCELEGRLSEEKYKDIPEKCLNCELFEYIEQIEDCYCNYFGFLIYDNCLSLNCEVDFEK